MRTAGPIFGIFMAVAALGACSHEPNQQAANAPPQGQAGETEAAASSACPLARLSEVRVMAADIKDGVAITFTAPDRELDQLRNNVHAMADANDKQGDPFAVCPCSKGGTAGEGAAEPMPSTESRGSSAYGGSTGYATAMPKADAKVDEISTGAVLKLTAKDASQVESLRSAVHQDVSTLKSACLNQASYGK